MSEPRFRHVEGPTFESPIALGGIHGLGVFVHWQHEHCPSAAYRLELRGTPRITVTIPDPDEAVAFKLRWC